MLDVNELHDFQCEHCTKPFQVLIKECLACGAESVLVWTDLPPADLLSSLKCSNCNKPFQLEEENEHI